MFETPEFLAPITSSFDPDLIVTPCYTSLGVNILRASAANFSSFAFSFIPTIVTIVHQDEPNNPFKRWTKIDGSFEAWPQLDEVCDHRNVHQFNLDHWTILCAIIFCHLCIVYFPFISDQSFFSTDKKWKKFSSCWQIYLTTLTDCAVKLTS